MTPAATATATDTEEPDVEVTDPVENEHVLNRDNPWTVFIRFILTAPRAARRAATSSKAKTFYAVAGSIALALVIIMGIAALGWYISNVLMIINPKLAYVVIGLITGLGYLAVAKSAYDWLSKLFTRRAIEADIANDNLV